MKPNAWILLAAALAAVLPAVPGEAQTMFRCGNKYQDRPCEGGQQGKAVGSATGSQSSPGQGQAAAGSDAECTQRGVRAQSMMWGREAGVTLEKALSDIDAKSPAHLRASDKKLAADVYAKRGSVPQVRSAIETDCVAQKEKAAQAAALMAAAAKAQADSNPAAAPVPVPGGSGASEADAKAAEERSRQTQANALAAQKKSRCDYLNTSLASARDKQRAGGNVQQMDSLNKQVRDIEAQLRSGGC